ncbi:MAG: DUF2062 domain-containing protein [Planctomycetota bacterium]|nr:DUF2062 domain-containing protein [Planctomycetota bacterium]
MTAAEGGRRFAACAVIPVYNHASTAADVAGAAAAILPTIVVDDGSSDGLAESLAPLTGRTTLARHQSNLGKGTALRTGFDTASRLSATHVVTLDADGQHDPADIPRLLEAARANPDAVVAGVRDLKRDGAPPARRFANAFSNFWFRVQTGIGLKDTQCGFRCYPLGLVRRLRTTHGGYAYELEVLVRAAWLGAPIVQVPIRADYARPESRRSHFRPILDFLRISYLNTKLTAQALALPGSVRARMSSLDPGGSSPLRRLLADVRDVLRENADTPARLALSVGIGLFFGIAPIWGLQMAAAAVVAHLLRLNKAIALIASNISIPPLAPFIIFGSLFAGRWLTTGRPLELSLEAAGKLTLKDAFNSLIEYAIGSIALGLAVGTAGALVAFACALSFSRFRKSAAGGEVEEVRGADTTRPACGPAGSAGCAAIGGAADAAGAGAESTAGGTVGSAAAENAADDAKKCAGKNQAAGGAIKG